MSECWPMRRQMGTTLPSFDELTRFLNSSQNEAHVPVNIHPRVSKITLPNNGQCVYHHNGLATHAIEAPTYGSNIILEKFEPSVAARTTWGSDPVVPNPQLRIHKSPLAFREAPVDRRLRRPQFYVSYSATSYNPASSKQLRRSNSLSTRAARLSTLPKRPRVDAFEHYCTRKKDIDKRSKMRDNCGLRVPNEYVMDVDINPGMVIASAHAVAKVENPARTAAGGFNPELSTSAKELICNHCRSRSSPEWRRGPDGKRTLCNACGIFFSKLLRKYSADKARSIMAERKDLDASNRRLSI